MAPPSKIDGEEIERRATDGAYRADMKTLALIGGISIPSTSIYSDNILYTAFFSNDTTGGHVLLNVGGVAAQTMTWKMNVQSEEIG